MMPVKTKKKAATKSPATARLSFYPHAEDLANLEQTRAELQAVMPDVHVSLSDAIRYAIREFRRVKDGQKNPRKIS